MANLDRDLERFLRKEIFAEREGKVISKFVLFHCPAGGKANEVETFKYREGMTADELRPLIDEVLSRAQSDADGAGGVQRYLLRAFVKGDTSPVSRFSFRLRGSDEDFEEGNAFDDAPNAKGLLTQLMRHNEAIMRSANTMMGTAVSMLARQAENANERLEAMTAQRSADFELMEKLRSGQHDRDMEMLQHEASEKRKEAMFEKFSILIPVVLNKLAGTKVVPSQDPAALMIKGFVDTLEPDQFNKILSALKPEQGIALIELVKSFQQPQLEGKE